MAFQSGTLNRVEIVWTFEAESDRKTELDRGMADMIKGCAFAFDLRDVTFPHLGRGSMP